MIFNPVVPMPKKIETIQARDIAVGNSVYLNEGGNYVEYLVVNHGIPSNSSLYDSSCNGTWLLRKDLDHPYAYNTSNSNEYPDSLLYIYFKTGFFNSLGTIEKSVIKQVKITYADNAGNVYSDLSCKVFELSAYEVGFTTNDSTMSVDGAKLSYFELGLEDSANAKRIAKYNESAQSWWLRSPRPSSGSNVYEVYKAGSIAFTQAKNGSYARPALILPFNAEFDKTNMRLVGVGNS